MFDEIAKRLRGHARLAREYNEDGKLFDEAADAIEEMQKCLDGVSADNDSLCEKLRN